MAEVIHIVADLFCKERSEKEGGERGRRQENGRVRRVIRFFYRLPPQPPPPTVHPSRETIPGFLGCSSFLFLFSRPALDPPNYSPGYTFSGFHSGVAGACGSHRHGEGQGGAGGPLSHLESNRGPLSKKLISLNIILGASGSHGALTAPPSPPLALS